MTQAGVSGVITTSLVGAELAAESQKKHKNRNQAWRASQVRVTHLDRKTRAPRQFVRARLLIERTTYGSNTEGYPVRIDDLLKDRV